MGERVCFVVSGARSKRTVATMPMVIAKRNKKRMLLAACRAVHAGCFRTDSLHHVVDGRSVAVAVKKHKNDDHDDGINDEKKYRQPERPQPPRNAAPDPYKDRRRNQEESIDPY